MIAENPDGFQLDADGYAVPQADLLADFLAEHGDDPLEGPPEGWPEWTDQAWTLGPDPDSLPLTDEADLVLLRKLNTTTPWTRWLAEPGELES